MPEFRDRIKSLRRVKASEIRRHPKNYRKHPDSQRDGLLQVLSEVGLVDAVLVYEPSDDQGLMLIDGELRSNISEDQKIPALILDVTDEEAETILATFDPLTNLAKYDKKIFEELRINLQVNNEAIKKFIDGLKPSLLPEDNYTRKVVSPVYEIQGEKPQPSELYDESKTLKLKSAIEKAKITDDIKRFLLSAAERHTRFDFRAIAEFYAHAPAKVKRLMEESALVIIDFDQAIEQGFVKLTTQLSRLAEADKKQ